MSTLLSPPAILLIGFIAAVVFATASFFADNWIRKNIPLPEDYPQGSDGEAMMLAEFERLRRIHEAKRRSQKKLKGISRRDGAE